MQNVFIVLTRVVVVDVSVKEAVNRLIGWSKDYVVVNTRNTTYKTISLHTWTYIRYLTMDQH